VPDLIAVGDLERLLADVRAIEARLVAWIAQYKAEAGRRVDSGAPAPFMTRLR
jgi:hypothetical protein